MTILPKRKRADSAAVYAFAAVFALMLLFNLWRVPSASSSLCLDEALYLSIPYRVLQGDVLLLHEWNMSQMAALLHLPLLKIYLAVVGHTDGILLAFRYIYVFFHSLVALYVFLRLRKTNILGASAAAVFYMAFCYSNIMALSYNTMSFGLMITVCVSMATARGRPAEMLLIGLAFAGAVLCCPFLLIAYAVYTLAVLFFRVKGRAPSGTEAAFSPASWLFFSLGCVFLAIIFFLPIIFSGDMVRLIDTLPFIVVDDEHPAQTPMEWLRSFYGAFYRSHSNFKLIALLCALLFALILADRQRSRHRWIHITAAAAISLYYALPYILMYRESNYLVFPLSILGFFAFLLCEKKDLNLFLLVYVPGLVFWVCRDMASNLGFSSICGGSVVNMVAAMIFIARLSWELVEQRQGKSRLSSAADAAGALIPLLAVLVLFSAAMYSRVEPAPGVDTVCTAGSTKGIMTDAQTAEAVRREYEALEPLRRIGEGNVLYFSDVSNYRYLEDSKNCSSHTMWFLPFDTEMNLKNMEKLEEYWALFPAKLPDYIYLPARHAEDQVFLRCFDKYDYSIMPLSEGIVLCLEHAR